MPESLDILAALIADGRRPGEALTLLGRSGSAWAEEAAVAVAAGADAGGAIARAGVRAGALDAGELDAIGGASALVDPAALRFVARRRAGRRRLRRAVRRALFLPVMVGLGTAVSGLYVSRSWGARLVDVLPLAAVVGVAALALSARSGPWLALFGGLTAKLGRWRLPGFTPAREAEALAAAAPLDAAGFLRAARLLPPGRLARGCERAARRLAAGESMTAVLPSAAEVGVPAASWVLLGSVEPAALSAVAAEAEGRAVAVAAGVVRVAAWGAVVFASLRIGWALAEAVIGGGGGLPGLGPGFGPGLGPGLDPAAVDELMREIEGR